MELGFSVQTYGSPVKISFSDNIEQNSMGSRSSSNQCMRHYDILWPLHPFSNLLVLINFTSMLVLDNCINWRRFVDIHLKYGNECKLREFAFPGQLDGDWTICTQCSLTCSSMRGKRVRTRTSSTGLINQHQTCFFILQNSMEAKIFHTRLGAIKYKF